MKDMIQYDMEKHEDEWQKNPIDTKYYIAFALGYDLLQEKFKKYYEGDDDDVEKGLCFCETDTCFDICLYLAEKFVESVEYATMDCSAYDALQAWLENYSDFIDEVTEE